MEKLLTIIALLVMSIQDLYEKRINVLIPVISGGILVAMKFYKGAATADVLAGVLVGGMLCSCSFLWQDKIGPGDGITLCLTGITSGFWENLMLLWIASGMAGIYGLFIFLFKKRGKDYEMPFVPFVLGGYIICILTGRIV